VSADEVRALAKLAEEHQRAGRLDQALGAWLEILQLNPDSNHALLRAGSLLAAQQNFSDALPYFTRVLEKDPDNVEANYKLGKLLQFQGQLQEAGAILSHVVELQPDHVAAVIDLGDVASAVGDNDAATAFYKKALDLDGNNQRATAGLAWLLDLAGEYQEALSRVEPMMKAPGTRVAFTVTWARLKRRLGAPVEALEALSDLLADPATDSDQRMRAHFLMGDLMDGQADYETAAQHYREGNRLKPVRFDCAGHAVYVQGLIDFFSIERLAGLSRAKQLADQLIGQGGGSPVFVVGMPRSGTSLVEQIIASHASLLGGGERLGIYAIERDLPELLGVEYPRCLEQITSAQLDELAGGYLEGFGKPDSDLRRVTDKFTTNFLALGLIEMLFPDARVIHCVRHPLDTVASCYFQDFLGEGLAWSYDLDHIGNYYVQYHRLMDHWRKVLTVPVMDLHYESLVKDPERWSRELIGFLGLEWDPACLEFYRQRRVVNTASYAQVREPIHTRSVNRHEHYAGLLEPAKAILEAAGISC